LGKNQVVMTEDKTEQMAAETQKLAHFLKILAR
jgi:hypothetical protein